MVSFGVGEGWCFSKKDNEQDENILCFRQDSV